MKLSCHQVILDEHAAQGYPVFSGSGYNRRIFWLGVIAVHKVEIRLIRDSLKYRVSIHLLYLVPAYVWHLEP